MKRRLREILHDSDLLHPSKDAVLLMGALQLANLTYIGTVYTINSLTGSDFNTLELNAFKTIEHAALGAFIGASIFRRMGGGFRGAAFGFGAVVGYSLGWEFVEPYVPNKEYNGESFLDSVSDVGSAILGGAYSIYLERFKSNLNKDLGWDKYNQ